MRNKYENKRQILHQSQPQNFGTSTCFGKTVVFVSSLGERGMRANSWYCHGKRNNLAEKEEDSRQKEEPNCKKKRLTAKKKKLHGKKKKTHGKRKNLTAKRITSQ